MTSKSATSILRLAGAWVALGLLLGARAGAGANEPFESNEKALATFDFEGTALPQNPVELKEQFPGAKRDKQRVDEELGLECFELGDLKNADAARFYFCDDRLYQFEIVYELPRVKEMGGMQALVQKLIDTWGPADHVGERRWTWQRVTYNRRADFYNWPDRAQLTITDIAWMPIVAQRQQRQDEKQRLDLGF